MVYILHREAESIASVQKKFHSASVEDVRMPTVQIALTAPDRDIETAGKVDKPPYMGISVTVESASRITQLPALTLRQMWGKAADLLSPNGQISPAPGCSPKHKRLHARKKHTTFQSLAMEG